MSNSSSENLRLMEEGLLNTCVICMEEYTNKTRKKLRCGHIFCADCINEWYKRKQTCPLCIKRIVDRDLSRAKRTRNVKKYSTYLLKFGVLTSFLIIIIIFTIVPNIRRQIVNDHDNLTYQNLTIGI